MSAVAVDTDVVSYLFKSDTRAELYRPHLTGKVLVISFMTLAELDRWAISKRWGLKRRGQMTAHLRQFVVMPYDRALCLRWAEACCSAERSGYVVETADAWIAATALLLDIPLVTNNPDDFRGIDGLTVLTAARAT